MDAIKQTLKKEKYKEILSLLLLFSKNRAKIKTLKKWSSLARENQLPPDRQFRTWLILAGRGFGKTRTGAETIKMWIEKSQSKRIGFIGRTIDETERIMVFGESGLLTLCEKDELSNKKLNFLYKSSQKIIFFPQQQTTVTLFSGDNFEKLRGPEFDTVWIDELAKFRYPSELIDQVNFSLRLKTTDIQEPRLLITTTPRPLALFKKIMEDPTTHVTFGTTFDNEKNLAPSFIKYMKKRYEGTRLGSQELYGEILTENEGALWIRKNILYRSTSQTDYKRVVIAIDPATTHHDYSDETGVIVAALCQDETYQILEDLSGKLSPRDWGNRVVKAYYDYQADRVVAEINKGGDLVEQVVRSIDSMISFKSVRATRGKSIRAEPIAALYEKRQVYHERPLRLLESQLCEYVPGLSKKSPDRLDALVWALTELTQKEALPSAWLF